MHGMYIDAHSEREAFTPQNETGNDIFNTNMNTPKQICADYREKRITIFL